MRRFSFNKIRDLMGNQYIDLSRGLDFWSTSGHGNSVHTAIFCIFFEKTEQQRNTVVSLEHWLEKFQKLYSDVFKCVSDTNMVESRFTDLRDMFLE